MEQITYKPVSFKIKVNIKQMAQWIKFENDLKKETLILIKPDLEIMFLFVHSVHDK